MSNVLVIGDTHCPVMLPEYPDFLNDTRKAWKCDRIVHIGDVADFHCISYHEKNPEAPSPEEELKSARKQIAILKKVFKFVDVMIGNHDALPKRKASTLGIPYSLVKKPAEIWETPNWIWHERFSTLRIDNVLYQHGDRGRGGQDAAMLNSKENFASLVQGHHHQLSFVKYYANEVARCFAVQTGCGIDWDTAAQSYGFKFNKKPVISCAIVVDGIYAYTEPMKL